MSSRPDSILPSILKTCAKYLGRSFCPSVDVRIIRSPLCGVWFRLGRLFVSGKFSVPYWVFRLSYADRARWRPSAKSTTGDGYGVDGSIPQDLGIASK